MGAAGRAGGALRPLSVRMDRGGRGKAFTAQWAAWDGSLLTPPIKAERKTLPAVPPRFIAAQRHRIEGGFTTETDQFDWERHRARSGWGLLTRGAAKLAPSILRTVWRWDRRAIE